MVWVDVKLFRNAEEFDGVEVVDQVHLVFVLLEDIAHLEVVSVESLSRLDNFLLFLATLGRVSEAVLSVVIAI